MHIHNWLLGSVLAISSPGIIKTLMMAYTVFTGGLLVPVLAGFYKELLGLTPNGALIALLGGVCSAILLGQKYPLAGMAISAILQFSISLADRHLFHMSNRTIRYFAVGITGCLKILSNQILETK